jgi:hypothetical protein
MADGGSVEARTSEEGNSSTTPSRFTYFPAGDGFSFYG